MNKFKALFIMSLRVKRGCTWRAVQRELWTRYEVKKPFESQFKNPNRDTNQIDGMISCKEAMKFLGQKEIDGWI